MAFFNPLGALSAGIGGYVDERRQQKLDQDAEDLRIGQDILGDVFKGWQMPGSMGGLGSMGQQGPQAPPPGMASQPPQPPPQPPQAPPMPPQQAQAGPPPGPQMAAAGPSPFPSPGPQFDRFGSWANVAPIVPRAVQTVPGQMIRPPPQQFGPPQPPQGPPQGPPPGPPQPPPQQQMPPQARAPMQPSQGPQQRQGVQFDQQGRPTFDLPTLVNRINQVRPNATPRQFAAALKAGLPLLNEEGKIQGMQMRQYMQEQGLTLRELALQLQNRREDRTERQGDRREDRLDRGQEERIREFDRRMEQQSDDRSVSPAVVDMVGQGKLNPPSTNSRYGRALLNAVAEKYPGFDATKFAQDRAAGIATATADPRAMSAAIKDLTQQQAAINAFENTAVKNGQVLISLAQKVDQTGIPAIEKWIRAGKRATGDPDVAMFHAQMVSYRAEAARIINSPSLKGVLTDTARKEIETALSEASSAEQIKAVVGLLTQDFGRRSDSIREELDLLRKNIRNPGGGGTQSVPAQQQPVQGGGGGTQPDPLGIR